MKKSILMSVVLLVAGTGLVPFAFADDLKTRLQCDPEMQVRELPTPSSLRYEMDVAYEIGMTSDAPAGIHAVSYFQVKRGAFDQDRDQVVASILRTLQASSEEETATFAMGRACGFASEEYTAEEALRCVRSQEVAIEPAVYLRVFQTLRENIVPNRSGRRLERALKRMEFSMNEFLGIEFIERGYYYRTDDGERYSLILVSKDGLRAIAVGFETRF